MNRLRKNFIKESMFFQMNSGRSLKRERSRLSRKEKNKWNLEMLKKILHTLLHVLKSLCKLSLISLRIVFKFCMIITTLSKRSLFQSLPHKMLLNYNLKEMNHLKLSNLLMELILTRFNPIAILALRSFLKKQLSLK